MLGGRAGELKFIGLSRRQDVCAMGFVREQGSIWKGKDSTIGRGSQKSGGGVGLTSRGTGSGCGNRLASRWID
jgi:hypothetical protein